MKTLETRTLLCVMLLLLAGFSDPHAAGQAAAEQHALLLKSGQERPPANAEAIMADPAIDPAEVVDGKYYRYLQFFEIPLQSEREALEQSGIELLDYIPNNAYIAAIPRAYALSQLQSFGVRSILPIPAAHKLDEPLKAAPYPAHAIDNGRVQVRVLAYRNVAKVTVQQRLQQVAGLTGSDAQPTAGWVTLSVDPAQLTDLAALPYLYWVEPIAAPDQPDDTEARGLHRNNVLAADYPSGRHYDGTGVSVHVSDDGPVGPHIDFTGRLDQSQAGSNNGSHGDMVAGIVCGAGNLDPRYRGMATGAFLYINNQQSAPYQQPELRWHRDHLHFLQPGLQCGLYLRHALRGSDDPPKPGIDPCLFRRK